MTLLTEINRLIEAKMGARVSKLIRYLISGGTAALINWSALLLLVQIGHMYYLYASVLAFVVSIAVSFTMQKFWTFNDNLVHDIYMQFTRYLIIIFLSLLLNTVLVYLLVEKMDMWYLLAQIIATAIIAITNFFWYRYFVFRDRVLQQGPNSIS